MFFLLKKFEQESHFSREQEKTVFKARQDKISAERGFEKFIAIRYFLSKLEICRI